MLHFYNDYFGIFHQLVKLCSGMIEAGRAYVSANKLFVNGIKDLSQQCKKEETISVSSAGVAAQRPPQQPVQLCTGGT